MKIEIKRESEISRNLEREGASKGYDSTFSDLEGVNHVEMDSLVINCSSQEDRAA